MPKYMLLFVDDETWRDRPKEEIEHAYAEVNAWWDGLTRKGVIKRGKELQPSRTAMTVRRVTGQMVVSDGPFIETKEQVGGYAVIEAADLDEAIAYAKSWPGGDLEIRPVLEH